MNTETGQSRCRQCKRVLDKDRFFYNGKDHTTCFACSKKNNIRKNFCKTCGIRANFNYVGETCGIYCSKCAEPDMVDIISPKCIVCKKTRPTFNKPGETKATHCSKCADPDMEDIKNPKCIVCKKTRPNYNKPGETKATHCSKCADPDMVDIKHPKCIVCKKRQPTYNKPGETKATHCSKCADPDMEDIKNPKCIVCKKTQPAFNKPGETKATHCSKCADPDMEDIKNPKCIVCKKTRPTYNKPGETKATHCKKCADPDMEDIKNPKCIVCKKTQPTYNKPGETKATHCKECADPDMVDIKNHKCIVCKKKQPNFNKPGETKATHCSKCAEPDMVDIKNHKCIVCKKGASYGIPCNLPSRCVSCKEDGMISNPRKKCLIKDCKKTAMYGSKIPIHCEIHHNDNDIYLVERKCSKCDKIDVLIDGLCVNFCCMVEKAKDIKKHQKIKEKRVLNIISAEYRKPDEYNKRIDRSCGGKESEEKEIVFDFDTHQVHVEVDEKQHKSYCKLGEFNRMNNIYMEAGGIPILFIRYNPDNYYENGKKIDIPQAKREELLIKWLKYYENIDNLPYNLAVHYLYYNDCNEKKCYEIDPYEMFEKSCDKCNNTFYIKELFEEHLIICR
jgi:hypothetical protein